MDTGIINRAIAFVMIAVVFFDVVSTIVVPRQISRKYRLVAMLIGVFFWPAARTVIARIKNPDLREHVRGFFGPLCFLTALTVWVMVLIAAFGLLFVEDNVWSRCDTSKIVDALYLSGSTILTLGVTEPITDIGKVYVVFGAMLGITLIGLCISYLFLLHNALSERERVVNTFEVFREEASDGVSLLVTFSELGMRQQLGEFFHTWTDWVAAVYETHRAFPLLLFFSSSSKHSDWMSSLAIMLDAGNLLQTAVLDTSSGRSIGLFRLGTSLLMNVCGLLQLQSTSDASLLVEESEFQSNLMRLRAAGYEVRDDPDIYKNYNLRRRAYWGFLRALAAYFADEKVHL